MRLRSDIWVKAYIRRCIGQGAFAAVVRHGDDHAGAIFIRVNLLDGMSMIFAPAPAGFAEAATDRQWVLSRSGGLIPDGEAETMLTRERSFDSDVWIVEVEDRDGRHFLEPYEFLPAKDTSSGR